MGLRQSVLAFGLGTCCALLATNLIGLQVLRSASAWSPLLPIERYTSDTVSANVRNAPELASLLRDNGLARSEQTLAHVLEVQRFVGDAVPNVGVYWGNESGYQLLRKGSAGTPLACGSLSQILNDSLEVLGYEARIVQLYRGDFASAATHVLVEVRLDGQWISVDPTWNVTYEHLGVPVSVAQVARRLSEDGPSSIKPRYYGDRRYPARIGRSDTDWRVLFSNGYVFAPSEPNLWRKLPPLKWWFGSKIYYLGDEPILWAKSYNAISFILVVVLPSSLLLGMLGLLAVALIGRRPAPGHR
jgi:hypothetical protein